MIRLVRAEFVKLRKMVAVRDRRGRIGVTSGRRQEVHLRGQPSSAPACVGAGIDHQPVRPRVEPVRPERAGDQVTLRDITAHLHQLVPGGVLLDALGDNAQAE